MPAITASATIITDIEASEIRMLSDQDLIALLTLTRRRLIEERAGGDSLPDWLRDWFSERATACEREAELRKRIQRVGGPSFSPGAYEKRIDAVKLDHNVVSVIVASGVDMRKRGRAYYGICPFHQETTPSLFAWPESGNWRCFGCGQHGDVLDYVQGWRERGLNDALLFLEGRAISVPARRNE